MDIEAALTLIAQYIFSLQYKIHCARQDQGKTEMIRRYQSLLSKGFVYHFLLLKLTKTSPAFMNGLVPPPFSGLLIWWKAELARLHISPLNSNARLGYALLQQSPYNELVDQDLDDLDDYGWLVNSIHSLKQFINSAPNVSASSAAPGKTKNPSASTLTPCMYLVASKILQKSPPKWLHSVDDLPYLTDEPHLLHPRPPQTLLDLAVRLIEYCRGTRRALDGVSEQKEVKELRAISLDCEIAYTLLLEYLSQDLVKDEDPASTFVLYDYMMRQFESLRRRGICRVFLNDLYPPLEESHDYQLCEAALVNLKAISSDAHTEFVLACNDNHTYLLKKFGDLADTADVIIKKLETIFQAGPDSNYHAANFSPISKLRQ